MIMPRSYITSRLSLCILTLAPVAVSARSVHAANDGERPLLLTPQLAAMGAVMGGLKETLPADLLSRLGPEGAPRGQPLPAGGEFVLPLPASIGGGEVRLSADEAQALAEIGGAIDVEIGVRGVRAARRGVALADTVSSTSVDLEAARFRRGPEVSFMVPTDDGAEEVTVVPDTLSSATVGVRKPIWDMGLRRLEKYIARRNYEVAKKELATAAGRAAMEAYQLCVELMRSQRQAQVAAVSLTQRKEILHVAMVKYANGQVPRFQVIEAERDVAAAEQLLAAAVAAAEKNEIALKILLRLDPERDIRVEPGSVLTPPDLDLEEMVRRAVGDVEGISARSDLRATEELAKRAAAEMHRPRVEKGPTIDLLGNVLRQTSTGLASETSWQIGFGATWNLWDSGSAKKQKRQLREHFEAAELRAEQAAALVVRQVISAHTDVQADGKRVDAARVEVQWAAEGFRIQMLLYEEGFNIAADVLDAEEQLTVARTALIDAEQDYNTSVARLRTAMGDWRALIGLGENL